MKDSSFLCESGDRIDNAVFDAIMSIAHDGKSLRWDMEFIGEVKDFIEHMLSERDIPTCHPWQNGNGHICYSTTERCEHCNK